MKYCIRLITLVSLVTFIGLTVPVSQSRAATHVRQSLGNYDIRVLDGPQVTTLLTQYAPTVSQSTGRIAQTRAAMRAGLGHLKQAVPGADVRFSPLFGAAEIVRSNSGALTNPAPGRAAADITLDFLHANKALYGLNDAEIADLHGLGESRSPANGMRMVRFEQQVHGLPVFQSDTRFIVAADGRLVRSVGLLVPGVSAAAVPVGQSITAAEALEQAMASVGITVDARATHLANVSDDGFKAEVVSRNPQIKDTVASQLVYFPLAAGVVIPAWSQVTYTSGSGDWYTLVDAGTGTVLWRKNIRSTYAVAPNHTTGTATGRSSVAQSNLAASDTSAIHQAAVTQSAAPAAVTQDARFSVYVQSDGRTPTSPAPHNPTDIAPGSGTQFPAIDRTTVSMLAVRDATASPEGWIPDNGTTTTGNNVDAYLDTNDNNQPDPGLLDSNGRPVGNPDTNSRNRDFLGSSPRNYSYTPAPQGNDPNAGDEPTTAQFRRGAVTQLFYISNWYHDQLYKLGFDEAAGNFQNDNFGRGGTGNDRVLAEAQDGAALNDGMHQNNANFSTPPDGQSGQMQMYLFNGPTPKRDGSLDADIVAHELTHGVSNRLIGNGSGLIWDVGGSMGEGWSDFYALSLLNSKATDNPNGKYTTGAYATYKLSPTFTDNYLYGIRRFPYTTDNSVNPLTWADVDDTTLDTSGGIPENPLDFSSGGGLEVHAAGEVWALSLWEVRSRIIADPAGANGNVPVGNATMLQLTTDALKLTPINPSFIDARDALIDADCATNACANEHSIWAGFADRGLGYGAVAPLGQEGLIGFGGHLGVGESFAVPALDIAKVTVDDTAGNNNGGNDPGEQIALKVDLTNPWQNAATPASGVNATLTTSTSGVTIQDNSATYGTIAAHGTASGDPFTFTLDSSLACGQSVKFTLQINSSLGTVSRQFTLRTGKDAGNGTPVTYTRTVPNIGLIIPDGDPRGVTDSVTVNDDLEIADLDFQIDSLSHTFTGDLAVMLKAPNGYGTDLIYHRGLFQNLNNINLGDGDNFTNTRIDDEATANLNKTQPNQAPFTGSWKPAFNSPTPNPYVQEDETPDPVGQLSRLDGTSAQGVWKVHLNDIFSFDFGTLKSWSLIVTPKAYSCAAVTPHAVVSGTKSVAGNTDPGSTITYTVTLKNSGSALQGDNAGSEFTDTLPAQLTLRGASASSGAVVAHTDTGVVDWNGSIAASSAVTLTISATINNGTQGVTVANQGQIAFDSDNNGTNDASAVTDDPTTTAANDPTSFVVGAPVIKATQVATLATDSDGDGKVGPGDTLLYKVVVTNSGSGSATDATFTSGLDPNTALVAGSITSTTGTITSGGTASSTQATVQIGTLPGGTSATIVFQATIASSLPDHVTQVSSQGTVSGSNFATVVTDDPTTPAPNDTTVTTIGSVITKTYVVALPIVISNCTRIASPNCKSTP